MKPGRRPKAHILVVEDDVTYGQALEELLRAEGHAVHHVLDGEAALVCIREMGDRLDLVICDLLLPRRSGFEVIREVAEMDLSLPILAMTGVYESSREIHALRGLGVKGYLHKSAPFDHIVFRVSHLLFPDCDDTRGNYRVAVSIPVQFKLAERVLYGTSHNLSVSGIYVRTIEPVVAGSVVEMALGVPTARQMVSVGAEVVHAATPAEVRGTSYPAGFGASFFGLTPLAATAIRGYVERVRAEETGEVPAASEEPVRESEPTPV